MQEMNPSQPATERRRSVRVSESLPLNIRGIDLLGQPFEERTATLALNLHGCKYASKHHLPKNSWVTLELARGFELHNVRARVASVHHPHSVREYFQIAVELETPANIWGLEIPPSDWQAALESASSFESSAAHEEQRFAEEPGAVMFPPPIAAGVVESGIRAMDQPLVFPPEPRQGLETLPVAENPLLRKVDAQLEQEARHALEAAAAEASDQIRRSAEEVERKHAATAEEFFRRWREEFESVENEAQERFSVHLSARQTEFLSGLKEEIEENLRQARHLLDDLGQRAQMLRAEKDAMVEVTGRVAQARLQMEADEAARASQPLPASEPSAASIPGTENAAAGWRQRHESEMTLAQAQWNELLQSSLDGAMERLVEQLAERSQDILRSADEKMADRVAELRERLARVFSDSHEALGKLKAAMEQEFAGARSSLAEIEHSANHMKEHSAQLEEASRVTLGEFHRRFEEVVRAQTDEMSRRAESLAASVPERAAASIDSLTQQLVQRATTEIESKLAPHVERVPALLRELAAREGQAEESLRLHRERLRQLAENSRREASAQLAATVGELHGDFEAARKEALAKWNEELDASGVRVSHAAAESIGRASEDFQQEARARLQSLAEEALAHAGTGYDEKASEATCKFAASLEEQSSAHLAQIHQKLEGVAGEVAGRTRTELEVAAEAAAASFGQALHSISDLSVQQFKDASHGALQQQTQELQDTALQTLRNLEASGMASLERLQTEMGSRLESRAAEGRSALASEVTSALDGLHAECETLQKDWAESLDRLSDDAVVKHQERLDIASDSWMVSSVHRLNERGQNTIEALMRSADQELRESYSKLFDRVAEILRNERR